MQIGTGSSNIADAISAPLTNPSIVFWANASIISFVILSSSWHVVGLLTSRFLLWLRWLPNPDNLASKAFTFSACSAAFLAAISSSNAAFNSSSFATFTLSLAATSFSSSTFFTSRAFTFLASVADDSVEVISVAVVGNSD